MLDLTCDPVGPVVETTLEEVVPGLILWLKREKYSLTHLCRGVLARLLTTTQVYCKRIQISHICAITTSQISLCCSVRMCPV